MQKNYRIGNDDFPAVVAVNPDGSAIGAGSGSSSGGGPATIVDGGDVTQGSKADAAFTGGTGAATIVSVLKGVYAQAVLMVTGINAATPAGANVIGGVTVADGSNATQGAKADALATNSTGTWSVVALLKGIYAQLVLTVAGLTAATPAGANVIGGVTEADGANKALGATADAAWASGSGSIVAVLKGIFGLLSGTGSLKPQAMIAWLETNGSVVNAGATFSGTTRTKEAFGVVSPYAYFTATLYTSSAGTLIIGNGYYNQTLAVAAGGIATLRVPAIGTSFTAFFTAGGTTGSISLQTAFSTS